MIPPRHWPLRIASAATTVVLLFGLAFAIQFPRIPGLTAPAAPPAPPARAAVPTSDTLPIPIEPSASIPGVGTLPPSSGPLVAAFETSPTVPAAIEGGFMPIETETTPLREMDEAAPVNIFRDPEVAAKLLIGRKPFLYDAKGRPDPMIIPWVRSEIVSNEQIAQAQQYMNDAENLTDQEAKKARYLQAIQELDRVIKADPTSRYGKTAQALKDKIRAAMSKIPAPGATPTPMATKPPELPPWVVSNTRAVIYDATPKHDSVVLVGDDMLRVGEAVPKYPEAKIVEVNLHSVVYEFHGTRITVKVEVDSNKE